MSADPLAAVFADLRPLLAAYAEELDVEQDAPDAFALRTAHSEKWGKPLPFGSVQVKKRYVSFHLFPVYMYPDLLEDVPETLERRMQGKSCFNFTRVGPELRAELEALIRRGYERFEREGDLGPER